MFKKVFSLSIIALMLFSCVAACSASRIDIDADWRLVHKFRIIDTGTYDKPASTIIWARDVAASDAHYKEIDGNAYKFHTLSILIGYESPLSVRVPQMNLIVSNYDGKDIDLWGNLKYRFAKPYDNRVDYTINGIQGNISEPAKII